MHFTIHAFLFNPLRAFKSLFWTFLKQIAKFLLCNAISQEWMNQNTKLCIPYCRKSQALTQKCQNFVIIFTVSGVTAVRSDHGVMSYIPDIGT